MGELDLLTAPGVASILVGACRALAAEGTAADPAAGGRLELDLSGIRFCGARGISMLLEVDVAAGRVGVALVLVAPSPAVRRVLSLSRTAPDFRYGAVDALPEARGPDRE